MHTLDPIETVSPSGMNSPTRIPEELLRNVSKLPRLPPLTDFNGMNSLGGGIPLDFRGPTPWCNYVIQGRVLAGAFPAVVHDADTHDLLRSILKTGVNTFVCLQAEFNPMVSEMSWKTGKTLRPYIKDAQKMIMAAKQARETGDTAGKEDLLNIYQNKLDLLHLPIVDGSIANDKAISDLADDCCQRILNGERLYIHCWGGHGRTGSLVALILSRLYGLSGLDALHYTQKMHDVRVSSQNTASPQTRSQILQVLRILAQQGDPRQYHRKFSWPERPLLPFTALEEIKWLKKLQLDTIRQKNDIVNSDTREQDPDDSLIKAKMSESHN